MTACKTYRVIFTDTRVRDIAVNACCHHHALAKAEMLYRLEPDNPRFGDLGGESFRDASAEVVTP
ncbi:MAG: hypothetical protein NW215_05120 [Hyphomicrobiales bacterium]|nr:hypothetical protein [Hyphomicrobiales bacterium]